MPTLPNSKNQVELLRANLYILYILGQVDSISNFEDILVWLLGDDRYPIMYGVESAPLVDGLVDEIFLTIPRTKPSEILPVWQIVKHIGAYLSEEQQKFLLQQLRKLSIKEIEERR